MTSEVIVDVQPKEISIALLEDKRLVEFQKEGRSASFVVGNIYLAKVRKLMPGLNACFVNVGYERDAFLHYLDLGPKFNSYTKYLKQVTSDKKKLYPIAKASNLPDLEKDGRRAEHAPTRPGDIGTDCQRTHFDQGPAPDVRTVVPRTLSGTHALPGQSIRFFQNQIVRGARTAEAAHPEHQAKEFPVSSCARWPKGSAWPSSTPNSRSCSKVRRHLHQGAKSQQTAGAGLRRNQPHGGHAAGFVQPLV